MADTPQCATRANLGVGGPRSGAAPQGQTAKSSIDVFQTLLLLVSGLKVDVPQSLPANSDHTATDSAVAGGQKQKASPNSNGNTSRQRQIDARVEKNPAKTTDTVTASQPSVLAGQAARPSLLDAQLSLTSVADQSGARSGVLPRQLYSEQSTRLLQAGHCVLDSSSSTPPRSTGSAQREPGSEGVKQANLIRDNAPKVSPETESAEQYRTQEDRFPERSPQDAELPNTDLALTNAAQMEPHSAGSNPTAMIGSQGTNKCNEQLTHEFEQAADSSEVAHGRLERTKDDSFGGWTQFHSTTASSEQTDSSAAAGRRGPSHSSDSRDLGVESADSRAGVMKNTPRGSERMKLAQSTKGSGQGASLGAVQPSGSDHAESIPDMGPVASSQQGSMHCEAPMNASEDTTPGSSHTRPSYSQFDPMSLFSHSDILTSSGSLTITMEGSSANPINLSSQSNHNPTANESGPHEDSIIEPIDVKLGSPQAFYYANSSDLTSPFTAQSEKFGLTDKSYHAQITPSPYSEATSLPSRGWVGLLRMQSDSNANTKQESSSAATQASTAPPKESSADGAPASKGFSHDRLADASSLNNTPPSEPPPETTGLGTPTSSAISSGQNKNFRYQLDQATRKTSSAQYSMQPQQSIEEDTKLQRAKTTGFSAQTDSNTTADGELSLQATRTDTGEPIISTSSIAISTPQMTIRDTSITSNTDARSDGIQESRTVVEPSHGSGSISSIEVQLQSQGEGQIGVRFVQRQGQVEVQLKSASQETTQLVLDGVDTLRSSLTRAGWTVESTIPVHLTLAGAGTMEPWALDPSSTAARQQDSALAPLLPKTSEPPLPGNFFARSLVEHMDTNQCARIETSVSDQRTHERSSESTMSQDRSNQDRGGASEKHEQQHSPQDGNRDSAKKNRQTAPKTETWIDSIQSQLSQSATMRFSSGA